MFIDVIIPLAVEGVYTYAVPAGESETPAVGRLVMVPFAGNKRYTGVVAALREQAPAGVEPKVADRFLPPSLSLSEAHLSFLRWIADYYMATPGEVIRAALPAALRLESHTTVALVSPLPEDIILSEREARVIRLLQGAASISVADMEKSLSDHALFPVIQSLLARSLVVIREEVDDLFVPRRDWIVSWARPFGEVELHGLLDKLKRAPAQEKLLAGWIAHTASGSGQRLSRREFFRRIGDSPAALKGLCDKGILQVTAEVVSRLDLSETPAAPPPVLSPVQEQALREIGAHFSDKETVLLHGVTSSGKTALYIRLIEQMLGCGKQVLYLLPEIALTVQIIGRLRRVFGNRVGIYHSGMSDSMRTELWQKQNGPDPYPVILGARSAVFLPFRQLGLVIVDEEHEPSYKQKEPAPRYHGRDAAMILATRWGGKILLGSATPSFESYRHALQGKYGLVTLDRRYGDAALPQLIFSDLSEARRKKLLRGSFTPLLIEEMARVLGEGNQVILFQNRRGYATYLQCDHCGEIPRCRQCDVSMTYYKYRRQLSCHYCGRLRPLPDRCESCGTGVYRERTAGTERIEEEVKELFPGVRVARMDLEVINRRSQFRHLLDRFEAGEIDVLIGTQMVSKGLDFDGVKLVGVMDAGNLLGFPDFRSEERTAQLLVQVSGRSGRKGEPGRVVIQVPDPANRLYGWVAANDYRALYDALTAERELFHYPPFCRLIRLELRHKEEYLLRTAANRLSGLLREQLGGRICGPAVPEVSRIRQQHRLHILVKIETTVSLSSVKGLIRRVAAEVLGQGDNRGIRLLVDVDPVQ